MYNSGVGTVVGHGLDLLLCYKKIYSNEKKIPRILFSNPRNFFIF